MIEQLGVSSIAAAIGHDQNYMSSIRSYSRAGDMRAPILGCGDAEGRKVQPA